MVRGVLLQRPEHFNISRQLCLGTEEGQCLGLLLHGDRGGCRIILVLQPPSYLTELFAVSSPGFISVERTVTQTGSDI